MDENLDAATTATNTGSETVWRLLNMRNNLQESVSSGIATVLCS